MERPSDVVITGATALTPIGLGFEALRRGLRRGEPRLAPLTTLGDATPDPSLVGGELLDFDAEATLGARGLRNKGRASLFVIGCLQLEFGPQLAALGPREEVGLAIGTAFGCYGSQIAFSTTYQRGGFRGVNALDFPNMMINAAASQANIWFELPHSSTTVANDATSGIDALLFAADQIACGRASCVIAGGVEAINAHLALALRRGGFCSASAQLRPFDGQRDGTLPGEGTGLLVLESRERAQRRGAPVLAELLGGGSAFSGQTGFYEADDPSTLARAMTQALRAAAVAPEQVDFVAAAGNGAVVADRSEAAAIHRVFGERASALPIVAYKSYWGESYGASGAMQAVAALADLQDGVISATCGFAGGDLQLAVSNRARPGLAPKTVIVNSVSYAGNCSALVLRRA